MLSKTAADVLLVTAIQVGFIIPNIFQAHICLLSLYYLIELSACQAGLVFYLGE